MTQYSRPVYSTQNGRLCPGCSKPKTACSCKNPAPDREPSDGIIRIHLDRKGRAGKIVSLVQGLTLDAKVLDSLARQLKSKCGCGGTVNGGTIEIQGDHRERLKLLLEQLGYRVKLAGG